MWASPSPADALDNQDLAQILARASQGAGADLPVIARAALKVAGDLLAPNQLSHALTRDLALGGVPLRTVQVRDPHGRARHLDGVTVPHMGDGALQVGGGAAGVGDRRGEVPERVGVAKEAGNRDDRPERQDDGRPDTFAALVLAGGSIKPPPPATRWLRVDETNKCASTAGQGEPGRSEHGAQLIRQVRRN